MLKQISLSCSNDQEKALVEKLVDVLSQFEKVCRKKKWSLRDLCLAAGLKPGDWTYVICFTSTYQLSDPVKLNYYLNHEIPSIKGTNEKRNATYAENIQDLIDIFEPVLAPEFRPDLSNDIQRLMLDFCGKEDIHGHFEWPNDSNICFYITRRNGIDTDEQISKLKTRFPELKIKIAKFF